MEPSTFFESGWVPETHDPRDRVWTGRVPSVSTAVSASDSGPLPSSVDLRAWCGAVRFQGGFPTCNAHVVCSLVEFFERRASSSSDRKGASVQPSPRFLFKVVKNFTQVEDASPVYIRQVMGVLRMVGVPPERYWPYPAIVKDDQGQYAKDDPALHVEPPAFCYAVAADYKAISYYRLDPRNPDGTLGTTPRYLLASVKAHCAAEVPVALGFPLYRDVVVSSWTETPGLLCYPAEGDVEAGGHAVVVVGYDDDKVLCSSGPDGRPTSKGALLVQNSWSEKWGEGGFGWLSYDYLLEDRARDFWTLTRADWVGVADFDLTMGSRDGLPG